MIIIIRWFFKLKPLTNHWPMRLVLLSALWMVGPWLALYTEQRYIEPLDGPVDLWVILYQLVVWVTSFTFRNNWNGLLINIFISWNHQPVQIVGICVVIPAIGVSCKIKSIMSVHYVTWPEIEGRSKNPPSISIQQCSFSDDCCDVATIGYG